MGVQREEVIVRAGFDNTALGAGLRTANSMITSWSTKVSESFSGLFNRYFGAGAIAGVTALFDKVLEKTVSIKNAAAQSGVGVEAIQKLDYAMSQLGIEIDSGNSALEKLNQKIGEAKTSGGEALAVFEKWGVSIDGSNEEIITAIANKMQELPDPAERAALAMDLMGRGGTTLIPLLEQGADAMRRISDHAPIFSEEDLKNLEQAHQQIAEIENMLLIGFGKGITWIKDSASLLGTLSDKELKKMLFKDYLNVIMPGLGGLINIEDKSNEPFLGPPTKSEIAAAKAALKKPEVKPVHPIFSEEERAAAFTMLRLQDAGLAGVKKYNALLKERGELYAAADYDANDFKHYQEDQNKLAQNAIDLANAKRDADLEILAINKQLSDLYRQQANLNAQMPFATIHDLTPDVPSARDIAGGWGFNTRLKKEYGLGGKYDLTKNSPFKPEARELERLQYQYAWNVMHPGADSNGLMGQQAARIKQIKGDFERAGISSPQDSLRSIQESNAKISENIATLLAKANTDGIPVKIPSN